MSRSRPRVWRYGAAALLLALAACSQSVAPAALLDMRSLPDDAQRRNERLDKAAARPAPENRKPVPSKLYRVETAAATAAAVLGMIFSSSPNVLLGAGTSIDENQLFDPGTIAPSRRGESGAKDEADPDPVDASQLVPWVKLRPEAAP